MAYLSGMAAILGGMVGMIFWTFHTIAHGPKNPAPTDGTFLGRTALEHARLMMLISPPLLLLGLAGVYHRLGSHAGIEGRVGAALIAISLTAMVLVSTGVGPWVLYAVSVIGLLLGHLLLGIAVLRAQDFPRWSRGIPLGIALALPLLVLARAPGLPPAESGRQRRLPAARKHRSCVRLRMDCSRACAPWNQWSANLTVGRGRAGDTTKCSS